MTVKRILRRIRLDKIAAVDSPCQQYATAGIVKRAPQHPVDSPVVIQKATFEEALDAQMISRRVNEAFYRVFDNLWTQNDAFKTALTDELSDGGDGSEASADYVASISNLVDQAVEAARDAGSKASDDDLDKRISDRLIEIVCQKGDDVMKIVTKAALTAAIAAFDAEKSPASHVGIIQKAATDLGAEDELPAEGPLAIAKADPAVADLKREVAVLKLAPEARTHFDSLDAAGQTEFLGKSADDQAAIVAKANETDPVVYTTKSGLAVRKSDGALALQLAKQADEQAGDIAKLRGETEADRIGKRAKSEFPNVAETVASDMLKSAAAAGEDTETGKAILKSLKLMNDGSASLFKRSGTSAASDPREQSEGSINKARQTFRSKVDAIAKRDNIGHAAAMEKAEIEEPALFEEAYPPVEPAEGAIAE